MKKLNVLIADDIEGWLLFHQQNLRVFLQDFDVNFYLFKSAAEAYSFVCNFDEKIDLVITDLEMEPMETSAGEWLVENLKLQTATSVAKYLIISSSYDISFVAQRTEVDGYLRKPAYQVNPASLEYKLKEIMGDLWN